MDMVVNHMLDCFDNLQNDGDKDGITNLISNLS